MLHEMVENVYILSILFFFSKFFTIITISCLLRCSNLFLEVIYFFSTIFFAAYLFPTLERYLSYFFFFWYSLYSYFILFIFFGNNFKIFHNFLSYLFLSYLLKIEKFLLVPKISFLDKDSGLSLLSTHMTQIYQSS